MINHIINNIFLGSYDDVIAKEELTKYNIKMIINMAKECKPVIFNNIKTHKYNVYDDNDITLEMLNEIYDKIQFYDELNENVFVHCAHGKSRSVCVILFYLIKKGYTLSEALEYTLKRRSIISPSANYIYLLSKIDITFDINTYYINEIHKIIKTNYNDNELIKIIMNYNYDLNKIILSLINI